MARRVALRDSEVPTVSARSTRNSRCGPAPSSQRPHLHPERPRYHRNRALVLLAKGEVEPALMALARSLSLDPDDQETLRIVADLEAVRSQSQGAPVASAFSFSPTGELRSRD